MSSLPATISSGESWDRNCACIIPHRSEDLLSVWAFCSSDEFRAQVRKINQKLSVAEAIIEAVPFDINYWQKVSASQYPEGLPTPSSSDSTQWLFSGDPKDSEHPLHTAVSRLLGYRWPRQTGSDFMDCPALALDGLEKYADDDGIVCINPIKGEQPAAERLRALLAVVYDTEWKNDKQNELLKQVGFAGKTMEDWLRNGFFEEHGKLFHQRPFIWQIWDGRKDGFSVLVNYHKLDHANLQKLIYTYLGDWIQRQKAAQEKGEEGSDARLAAALELKKKLELILEGEDPYDIFIRWKKLVEQPIGWNPDLNDGVRLNIRPFMTADVLRWRPNIKWNKDRGKDIESAPWYSKYDRKQVPDYKSGDRINDYHLTLDEKRKTKEKK
jgi:hypothetical protein